MAQVGPTSPEISSIPVQAFPSARAPAATASGAWGGPGGGGGAGWDSFVVRRLAQGLVLNPW